MSDQNKIEPRDYEGAHHWVDFIRQRVTDSQLREVYAHRNSIQRQLIALLEVADEAASELEHFNVEKAQQLRTSLAKFRTLKQVL